MQIAFYNKIEEAHQHPNGGGWVADTATVHPTCYVGPEALVGGHATMFGLARLEDQAQLFGYAVMTDSAVAKDHAIIRDDARATGATILRGFAHLQGNATAHNAIIDGATLEANCIVSGGKVYGGARVGNTAFVEGEVCGPETYILDSAWVKPGAVVRNDILKNDTVAE